MFSIKEMQNGSLPVDVSENVASYNIETVMSFTVNVKIDLATGKRTAEVLEFNNEIDDWTGTPVEYNDIADLVPMLLVPRI